MRNRIILFSLLILAVSTSSQAQFKYGLRGGVNISNMSDIEVDENGYTIQYAQGDIGYHFGVVTQLKLLNVFVQPELLFTTAKNDIKLTIIDGDISIEPDPGRQTTYKLDIPVLAGVKLGPIKVQAGPVGTLFMGSKSDLLKGYNIENNYKGFSVGYQAGLGLELSSLLLDVKYEGNLSELGSGIDILGQTFDFDQRMNQWILSIGFLF